MLAFEQVSGKPFEIKGLTDQLLYYYCVLIACNSDMSLTFEEFINEIDNDENILTAINKELSITDIFNGEQEDDGSKKK